MIPTEGLAGWTELPFFYDTLPKIERALRDDPRPWLPPPGDVFAALRLTHPDDVRVVILGQDPYPTPGHAQGLAFSAAPDTRPLPRSLSNIYKELQDDLGGCPPNADLRFWARQGVLLLNTVLTVPAGQPQGHARLGWQVLATQILTRLHARDCAYLLWGAQAHKAGAGIDAHRNLVVKTAHPSPLSARRGFFGARPFSRINGWLQARGEPGINWTTPEAS